MLDRAYEVALRHYLERPDEALLQQAYELGRRASARGLGVLEVARIHQQALAACLLGADWTGARKRTLRAAEIFLMELLSPFEAAHRGFRQVNERLRQLNDALAQRNAQLAATNRELGQEMTQRKRTEQALRDGEQHYRQLFDEALVMQEKLGRLSSQILHAQEDERRHISHELHDEIGQVLTAINIHLALLQSNGQANAASLHQQVAEIRKLVEQTMDRVRAFARELRPPLLDELGLVPALRSWLKPFAERAGLRLRFEASAEAEQLDEAQKIVLYRVTQESLTNVAMPSGCRSKTMAARLRSSASVRPMEPAASACSACKSGSGW